MRWILLVLLSGCVAVTQPLDSGHDAGYLGPMNYDAIVSPLDDAVTVQVDDAPIDRDAGPAMCAGLPLGAVILPVLSSSCDGPFRLAQEYHGFVRDSGSSCVVARSTLLVLCNGMPTDVPFTVGTLNRVGTTYSSPDIFTGCEDTQYQCHMVLDGTTDTRDIECSLDFGRTWCTIALE